MRSVDRGCRDMGTVKGNGKTDEDRARKKGTEAPGPWHHRRDHQQWPEECRGLPVVSGSEQGRWGARGGGGEVGVESGGESFPRLF